MALPEETGDERVQELSSDIDADLARYREVTAAMSAMAKAGKTLKEEGDALKAKIVKALAVDEDVDTEEKVIGTRNGHPVLRATIFPTASFQAKDFRAHHPEVYQKYLKVSQQARLNLS